MLLLCHLSTPCKAIEPTRQVRETPGQLSKPTPKDPGSSDIQYYNKPAHTSTIVPTQTATTSALAILLSFLISSTTRPCATARTR